MAAGARAKICASKQKPPRGRAPGPTVREGVRDTTAAAPELLEKVIVGRGPHRQRQTRLAAPRVPFLNPLATHNSP
jgi:hypothetical protein